MHLVIYFFSLSIYVVPIKINISINYANPLAWYMVMFEKILKEQKIYIA